MTLHFSENEGVSNSERSYNLLVVSGFSSTESIIASVS